MAGFSPSDKSTFKALFRISNPSSIRNSFIGSPLTTSAKKAYCFFVLPLTKSKASLRPSMLFTKNLFDLRMKKSANQSVKPHLFIHTKRRLAQLKFKKFSLLKEKS